MNAMIKCSSVVTVPVVIVNVVVVVVAPHNVDGVKKIVRYKY